MQTCKKSSDTLLLNLRHFVANIVEQNLRTFGDKFSFTNLCMETKKYFVGPWLLLAPPRKADLQVASYKWRFISGKICDTQTDRHTDTQ